MYILTACVHLIIPACG